MCWLVSLGLLCWFESQGEEGPGGYCYAGLSHGLLRRFESQGLLCWFESRGKGGGGCCAGLSHRGVGVTVVLV